MHGRITCRAAIFYLSLIEEIWTPGIENQFDTKRTNRTLKAFSSRKKSIMVGLLRSASEKVADGISLLFSSYGEKTVLPRTFVMMNFLPAIEWKPLMTTFPSTNSRNPTSAREAAREATGV